MNEKSFQNNISSTKLHENVDIIQSKGRIVAYIHGIKVGYLLFSVKSGRDVLKLISHECNISMLCLKSSKLNKKLSWNEDTAYVDCLFVEEEYRQQGIATKLMKSFLEYLHENCIFQCVLRAIPFESKMTLRELVEFYKKFKFKIIDKADDEYSGVLMLRV